MCCYAGARRDSHKPNEILELQNFTGKILSVGAKSSQGNTLASKCMGSAFSGNMDGGAGTPRNTAATDAAGEDFFKAIKVQQALGSKMDVQGILLQSFQGLDLVSGPAGTPRSTANTGD